MNSQFNVTAMNDRAIRDFIYWHYSNISRASPTQSASIFPDGSQIDDVIKHTTIRGRQIRQIL
ncbi:hypothetical protein DSCW_59780 [Desulfosarcina widdelii]|uniref:Uncharacterized protein n=1 Tax=Desulfosarcina widdelii TaxID=947919 RepID=A0A5K7ZFI7_9BACT|nr:hypothetical protein DSCW_59780 [Desulfosarcina widdelii]